MRDIIKIFNETNNLLKEHNTQFYIHYNNDRIPVDTELFKGLYQNLDPSNLTNLGESKIDIYLLGFLETLITVKNNNLRFTCEQVLKQGNEYVAYFKDNLNRATNRFCYTLESVVPLFVGSKQFFEYEESRILVKDDLSSYIEGIRGKKAAQKNSLYKPHRIIDINLNVKEEQFRENLIIADFNFKPDFIEVYSPKTLSSKGTIGIYFTNEEEVEPKIKNFKNFLVTKAIPNDRSPIKRDIEKILEGAYHNHKAKICWEQDCYREKEIKERLEGIHF